MSIEKRSDLFREYARVIDICEGAGVTPNACVRFDGTPWLDVNRDEDPEFDSPLKFYTFAVAILEGKPVFVADEIYHDQLGKIVVTGKEVFSAFIGQYSWNKPKRTFKLAGYELPVPDHDPSLKVWKQVGDMKYYFDSSDDANSFSLSIQAIIHEAIENARLQNK